MNSALAGPFGGDGEWGLAAVGAGAHPAYGEGAAAAAEECCPHLRRIPAFATVGENDPGGDEKFFSLSRQARLVALVATQSISSLRSALPGESWRTLLQTFRTRIFLTLSDESS